jgi:hypothetical protein
VVDYRTLFMVPTGMALLAVLLLGLFFRPPTRGPDDVTQPSEANLGTA